MTTLLKARHLRIAGFALGAVAVAGVAIAVTASAAGMSFGFNRMGAPRSNESAVSAVDAASTSSVCSDFMQHFATEIGKSQAEINAAFQKAVADTLADEVRSGQITQTQANAIEAKLANQTPCHLPNLRAQAGSKGALAAFMRQYLAAAASALGIAQTQLTTDLKSGQSLSQIAAGRHVSEAEFRTKVIAVLKPALDQAVANKAITTAQEQAILSRLQTGELPLWNTPVRRPKPAATPTPTPA
jgi:hypothetical protein